MDPDKAETDQVGAGGLSLATTQDWATLLHQIENPLGYPIQIETGPAALAITALFAAYLEKEKLPLTNWQGCIACDPV